MNGFISEIFVDWFDVIDGMHHPSELATRGQRVDRVLPKAKINNYLNSLFFQRGSLSNISKGLATNISLEKPPDPTD